MADENRLSEPKASPSGARATPSAAAAAVAAAPATGRPPRTAPTMPANSSATTIQNAVRCPVAVRSVMAASCSGGTGCTVNSVSPPAGAREST